MSVSWKWGQRKQKSGWDSTYFKVIQLLFLKPQLMPDLFLQQFIFWWPSWQTHNMRYKFSSLFLVFNSSNLDFSSVVNQLNHMPPICGTNPFPFGCVFKTHSFMSQVKLLLIIGVASNSAKSTKVSPELLIFRHGQKRRNLSKLKTSYLKNTACYI